MVPDSLKAGLQQLRQATPKALGPLHGARLHQLGEAFKTAVVGSLDVGRETTGGELPQAEMVMQTLATNPLFLAAGITAVAPFQVGRFFTFHNWPSCGKSIAGNRSDGTMKRRPQWMVVVLTLLLGWDSPVATAQIAPVRLKVT
jgi:hypothetical protein